MKIAQIVTGGTISSATNEKGIIESGKTDFAESLIGADMVSRPFVMLSENFEMRHVVVIAEEVEKLLPVSDGIIITTGSDAQVSLASFLSFIFSGAKKPIVLVASDTPPGNEKSNAKANIVAAKSFVEFCATSPRKMGGVFVAYKNEGEVAKIHFGSRLLESRSFDGYVCSALNKICATFNGSINVVEWIEGKDFPAKELKNVKKFATVPLLSSYIGSDLDILKERSAAVVVSGYHSGAVRTEGKGGVNDINNVFVAGGVSGAKYESSLKLGKNVRVVDNITAIALRAKLVLCYSLANSEKEIAEIIATNYCGEIF